MLTIKIDDFLFPEDGTEDDFYDRLPDPIFRICNLYTILDAEGCKVPFIPNDAQLEILEEFYRRGSQRLAVPKARQRGISTVAAIIALDECYWGNGFQASIVDQTQGDASDKLSKAELAYSSLHSSLRADRECITNNSRELGWNNNGAIHAGKNARGGTNQFLHISEWGPIAYDDPKRSAEILSGAIPSVSGQSGKILAESTHKGGRGGDWYDTVHRGLTVADEDRTPLDFKVLFFPWYDEPRYTLYGKTSQIDRETRTYLAEKEEELGIELTPGQKLWYYKKKQEQGKYMLREYPTTIDECWEQAADGVIYAKMLDKCSQEGRISNDIRYYAGQPVYTCWDLGAAPNQRVACFQVIHDAVKWLEVMRGDDDCDMPADWAMRLIDKKYKYGGHFLPHDGETLWMKQLTEAGLKGVACLEKPKSVMDGINDALTMFSRFEYNADSTAEHRHALGLYHCKTENDGVTIKDVPVHDWTSHDADCMRVGVQAIREGRIQDRSAMPGRANQDGRRREAPVRGIRFTNRRRGRR
jgi:hypothetical protein